MRSESNKVISFYDVSENIAKKLFDVLSNDLKEYEALDTDFGEGTESAITEFVNELKKHV